MGILENKVRATASVHRRRPWNGELCRFVQPAASWCAPTRYFGLSFAAERPPSANIGSKQNYKLCPTPLAPRTLPTSTIRRSCCLAPCNVLGATRATRYTAAPFAAWRWPPSSLFHNNESKNFKFASFFFSRCYFNLNTNLFFFFSNEQLDTGLKLNRKKEFKE